MIGGFTVQAADDRVEAVSGVQDKSLIYRYSVLTEAN
jgi:hypothetical protein